MEISRQKLNEGLEKFETLVEYQVNLIKQGDKIDKVPAPTEEYTALREELEKVIEDISKTGDPTPYSWKSLRSFIIIMAKDVLNYMHSAFPDMKTNQGESFDEELDVILRFICDFEQKQIQIIVKCIDLNILRPPFTLQRICELLINPKRNYQSSKKILFALEKLVNVTTI